MSYQSWRNLPKVAGFLSAAATSMITPAYAELLATPEAITLAGTRSSTVSTTLTLSGETDAITLEPAVSDLRRADGAASIAAADVVIEPDSTVSVPADAPTQVKLTIDLSQASANGEFTGALYLYHEAGRQVIPLTVRVKAAPIWPWILMFAGVALGSWLSFYRDEGRIRDEILLAVSRFQNRVEADPELGNASEAGRAFRTSMDNTLKRVVLAVEDKDLGGDNNFDVAHSRLTDVSDLWDRWINFREDWIAQFRYAQQLAATLQEIQGETDAKTIFMQGLQDHLDAVYRKLRTGQYETPQFLSEEFIAIRQQISFYRIAEKSVDDLKKQSQDLADDAVRRAWSDKLNSLMTQLDNSEPNQDSQDIWQERFNSMQAELEAEIEAYQKAQASEGKSIFSNLRGRSGGVDSLSVEQIPLVPSISSGTVTPERGKQANRNLFWFNQTSRGIAIIGLAWIGMIELYTGKPTFGADPMRDYFALLAWGFGAEVTRESVVKATQSLGVTLGNQKDS